MRWRLFLAVAGVVTLILVGQDVPLAGYLRQAETDRVVAQLERDAFMLAGGSADHLDGRLSDTANLRTTLNVYARQRGGRVVVVDARGRLVAASDSTIAGQSFADRPEIVEALAGRPASGSRSSETAGGQLVYIAVPVVVGARTLGAVRITYPQTEIDDRVDGLRRGLFVVFGISLVAALLAALLVARQLGEPLRRLRASTDRVAAGDLTTRAEEGGPAVTRQLATSFNAMTVRLEELVARQRAFAGDASHQLRSPLTALRIRLEQAALSTDGRARDHQLEAAIGETERLQRIVDGLLMLARAGSAQALDERVDLVALVEERMAMWSTLAAERDVTISGDVPPSCPVRGSISAVEQILDNYLDNALSVSPQGGQVSVTVAQRGVTVEVHVFDRGPGMSPEALKRAFDRFWRSPEIGYQGSGLGLAIVDQLARACGGSATLANRPDGGLDASVTLRSYP